MLLCGKSEEVAGMGFADLAVEAIEPIFRIDMRFRS
jgi:hypothetical protein